MPKLIPNSFQTPNLLIDQLAHLLTPEENTVLAKAVREILGWHNRIESRKAPIALAIFVDGKFNEAGDRLCYGCGLSIGAVRRALVALDKYAILVKVGRATQDGQTYWLQVDDTKIKWAELNNRLQGKKAKRKKQTKEATKIGGIVRRKGVSLDDRSGVSLDDRSGVSLDDNKETHLETQGETQTDGFENPPTTEKQPPVRDPLTDAFNAATSDEPPTESTGPNPDDAWIEYGNKIWRLYKQQTAIKTLNPEQKGALSLMADEDNFNWQKFQKYLSAFALSGGYAYNVADFITGYSVWLKTGDIDIAMGRRNGGQPKPERRVKYRITKREGVK